MNDIEDLIYKYADCTINSEEFLELEEALRNNPKNQDLYCSILANEAALLDVVEEIGIEGNNEKNIKLTPSHKRLISISIITSLAAIITLCFTLFNSPTQSPSSLNTTSNRKGFSNKFIAQERVIAVVAKGFGNHSNSSRLSKGDLISAGPLEISEGTVQLEFTSGAIMILEGPALLDVKNDMEVICLSGKLTVEVPDIAHGFTVTSNALQVKDLGTSFSMFCHPENSYVEVNSGAVELIDKGNIIETLHEGQSRSWSPTGNITDDASGETFISHRDIEEHVHQFNTRSYSQWKDNVTKLESREDLVLFYDFERENQWSRELTNRGKGSSNGAIIGAEWVQGRWPQKAALRFRGVNDRVRLDIPGEFEQITMTAWIRIESFDQWLSSLLLTDGFNEGALHWQVSDEGEIIAGINSGEVNNVFSEPVLGINTLGQWLFLAITYDAKQKEVVHYLNGQEITRGQISSPQHIQLGVCEIGNWRGEGKRHSIRGFNGVIDEFMIFSSTLTKNKILKLYQQGKP